MAKALYIIGTAWIYIAFAIIAIGSISTLIFSGWGEFLWLFSPFNWMNFLVIVLTLAPGVLLQMWSKKLVSKMDLDESTHNKYRKTEMNSAENEASIFSTIHHERDEQYDKVKEFVLSQKQVSAAILFDHFHFSFVRSTKYIEMLEEDGLIGPGEVNTSHDVL